MDQNIVSLKNGTNLYDFIVDFVNVSVTGFGGITSTGRSIGICDNLIVGFILIMDFLGGGGGGGVGNIKLVFPIMPTE
jgi:hypothetical protein